MTSRMIRALIVDDEPLARERLVTLLKRHEDVEVIAECASGRRAVAVIRKEKPDLVFLDVQMPELSGFEVIEAVGVDAMPTVIFVTAYDKYAIKAFEVHALDYLLKPFDRERFDKALEHAREHIEARDNESLSQRLMLLLADHAGSANAADRLVIRSGGRITFLKTSEIEWIEASGNYARIHTHRDEHLLRETLTELETRLDSARFARIHRSTIVNIDCIKELEPIFHGDLEITLRNGTRLTLSRAYRSRLERLLGNRL